MNNRPSFPLLTERQELVLQMTADGKPTKAIAKELNRSLTLIRSDLRFLKDATGFQTEGRLIAKAVEEGIIKLN